MIAIVFRASTKTVLAGVILAGVLCAQPGSKNFAAADLFDNSKVWTANLTIAADQWVAMQPQRYDRAARMAAAGEKPLKNGSLAMGGTEFNYVSAELEFEGLKFANVGVRYKGNFSFMVAGGSAGNDPSMAASKKLSYKVHLNQFQKGVQLAGVTALNFQNNAVDPGWMNEVLAYRLYRDAGVPAPRTSYAKLYLTIPGRLRKQYLGLYSLSEDVDKVFLQDRFGTSGSAVIKPYDKSDLFGWRGDSWLPYVQLFEPKSEFTAEEKRRFIDFCALVSKADDAEFARRLPEFVDIDEFARFMAVTVLISDSDNIIDNGHNFYAVLDAVTNRLTFIPWDLDNAFGHYETGLNSKAMETRSVLRPWSGKNHFVERVFAVEAFRSVYLARLAEFHATLFRPERIATQVDELAVVIGAAVQEESAAKRRRFDQFTSGEVKSDREIPIKPFVAARYASVAAQLAAIH